MGGWVVFMMQSVVRIDMSLTLGFLTKPSSTKFMTKMPGMVLKFYTSVAKELN